MNTASPIELLGLQRQFPSSAKSQYCWKLREKGVSSSDARASVLSTCYGLGGATLALAIKSISFCVGYLFRPSANQ
eukprot:scaffold12139_cov119-Skeletonema_marinoi.AAC.3